MAKPKPVILFGASGHGKVIADIIQLEGKYALVGFCDDRFGGPSGRFFGSPILGGREELLAYAQATPNVHVIVSIGNNAIRADLVEWLDTHGLKQATAVHPSAQIGRDVVLGEGTVVMARAVINADVTIGRACIINTVASVDHDCTLGDFVHVAPGARLCGLVTMKDRSMAGAGSVIIPGKTVGAEAMVEAGAVVIRNVSAGKTVSGVPASVVPDSLPPVVVPQEQAVQKNLVHPSPKQLNIMFTCAGRRVELIQSFRRAMESAGLRGNIVVADANWATAARYAAHEYVHIPHVRQLKYIPSLLEIVKEKQIHLLIPLTDLDIRPLARQKSKFEDLGCTVMVGDKTDVDICRNKLRFSRHLEKNLIPHVACQDLQEFIKNPFFPCFAKPLSGSGSIGACRIESMVQLKQHVKANTGKMVIQPFVTGREYTVDVYRARNGDVKAVVPRIRLRIRAGEVEQGITVKEPELIGLTHTLCEAFPSLWGVFCAQCRKTEDGEYLFFELNPRFGGGAPLSIAAGADFPMYLLQDVLGLNITADGSFHENMIMMRYPAAAFETIDDPTSLPGYRSPIIR